MLKITRRSTLILSFVVLLVAMPAAHGAECLRVDFADSVRADGANLVLNGLGIRKATILAIKVYVAGLYLPQRSPDPGQILGSSQPWQLTLRFLRDVGASDIREAFDEGFRNALADKGAALRPQTDALKTQIMDIKKGQYITLANDPAKGVTVDVNGTAASPIAGADFATALLSIWLGPEPPNADLKTGLLGGRCE